MVSGHVIPIVKLGDEIIWSGVDVVIPRASRPCNALVLCGRDKGQVWPFLMNRIEEQVPAIGVVGGFSAPEIVFVADLDVFQRPGLRVTKRSTEGAVVGVYVAEDKLKLIENILYIGY
jgi:hypothetical protein